MLGKLIKNDFKTSFHYFGMMYLVIAISVGVFSLSFLTDNRTLMGVSGFFSFLISMATIFISLVLIFYFFYSTLYSNQGYLSLTLPVKSRELIFSKGLTSFVWFLLSYIISTAIMTLLINQLTSAVGDETIQTVDPLLEMFLGVRLSTVLLLVAIYCVKFFIFIIMLIAMIFFTMTLSTTRVMQKRGALGLIMALGLFFAMFFVYLIFYFLVVPYVVPGVINLSLEGLSISFLETGGLDQEGLLNLKIPFSNDLLAACYSAILFTCTSYLMRKKVNLK